MWGYCFCALFGKGPEKASLFQKKKTVKAAMANEGLPVSDQYREY